MLSWESLLAEEYHSDVPALSTELRDWSWISFDKFPNLLFAFPVTDFIKCGRVIFAFFHLYYPLLNISCVRVESWPNDGYKLDDN